MPRRTYLKTMLAGGVCAIALSAGAMAQAQTRDFDVPAGDLSIALDTYARQSGIQIIYRIADVSGVHTRGAKGALSSDEALAQLLEGTNFKIRRDPTGAIAIAEASDPQSGSAAGDGADGTVQALIVTAQKREEDIQDVPIAISAFTQEDLTRSQVAGGPDLMTQVPNFTFTKTNFSSYSIQIRGIGTQAISATVDPAVAVAFNNTPFIRNRFFEQEFYDLERVEVLRGPQGTLYGRNATAGVVNILSAKPTFHYEAKLSGDVANYGSTRLEGMLNVPLVEDKVALRLAGAWTKRDGFVTNELTNTPIDGRDLWSTRLSLRIEPTEHIRANLVWEHFQEDDDRLRSGKQLCKRSPNSPLFPAPPDGGVFSTVTYTSQGCEAASLYSPDSFQVPNGFALPYYGPISATGVPIYGTIDPYVDSVQSRDLRVIQSQITPIYKGKSDLAEIRVELDLSESLTLVSETGYNADRVFSLEDFNRFNTSPGVFIPGGDNGIISDEGEFCDPQIGCSDRLLGMDISTADSHQFSQEFRLSSDFDGPFNFNLGANFLRYDTVDKYYVFFNTLTLYAAYPADPWTPGVTDNLRGGSSGLCAAIPVTSDPFAVYSSVGRCRYIDPNPIGSLNDFGRNYFLSKNPYKLISYAVFGEAQYDLTPTLKLTAGLRWTVDKKEAPQIPSWLLAGTSYGLPVAKVVNQEWREPTGRLVVDWKPDLDFTDETLVYASYAHGYKAGGANPPPPVNAFEGNAGEVIWATQPQRFGPEFVNAFEIGTKNTLLDGRLTLNGNLFYYDYTGYQVSQIVNRSAVNLNFDAKIWGAELEADWRPLENLRFGFKVGHEMTRMADGSRAIDTMDRTAGDPNYIVIKSFPTNPSNCILPLWFAQAGFNHLGGFVFSSGPTGIGACAAAFGEGVDPLTGYPYVPYPTESTAQLPPAGYPGFDPSTVPNNGQGIFKNLGGNELPNAPHYTATLTADYTLPLPSDWLMTLHTDLYYQSEAWTRVFNTPGYDKLKAYTNVNFAAIFTNQDAGWKVMAYVKNVFDRDSITGAFLNSDDTGLTTNVFLTEPRLYGLRVTKEWTGMPWSLGAVRPEGEPYPFTVELSGGPSRLKADNAVLEPDWLDRFRPSAGFPLGPQNEDLDWGDTREIRLTYAPGGRNGWRLSAAARYGRANGENFGEVKEYAPGFCILGAEKYDFCRDYGPLDFGNTRVKDRENYTMAEFMVGKEVGIGSWGEGGSSVIGVGLAYAQLTSETRMELHSNPDYYFPPEYAIKYDRHWHTYDVKSESDRSFTGVGPKLSWDAAAPILGGSETGRVAVDWSVNAGLLFGKRKATVQEETSGQYLTGSFANFVPPTPFQETPPPRTESKSVQVPTLGASLGLSYDIQRIEIGAGYRWERYFDAIDGGGISERKSYDRTIDGPYFKVSVGFGG